MRHPFKLLQRLLTLALLIVSVSQARAADGILTVEADGKSTTYSYEDLANMPQASVTTINDYVDAKSTFTGPLLRDVLTQNGIDEKAQIKLVALNDFSNTIPASDAFKYEVILALQMNDKKMSVRDKGPIWVIYPMDNYPELQDDLYNGRLVWQLKSIALQ